MAGRSVACACCTADIPFADWGTKAFLGECIGTCIMCLFGIGAVGSATLFQAMNGPFQVGMVWGLAIAIGIYVTRNLSCAHFNPAVSLAMCIAGRMSWNRLPIYVIGQCVGAFLAASILWILFADSVYANMAAAGIDMSVAGSASAIWCEPYPNTSNGVVNVLTGSLAEGIGVFVLVFVIFSLTESCNIGRPHDHIAPLFIGLTVTLIICFVGPLTDAGLNPARDVMPRVVAFLAGWHTVAFSIEAAVVYVVSPLIAGVLASVFFTHVIEPVQQSAAAQKRAEESARVKAQSCDADVSPSIAVLS